jgi:DUF177 domain-containing protein
MSEPWSQLIEVDRLADRQADVAFEIPLSRLPRVQAQIAGAQGSVRGVVHFRREAGLRVAEIEMEGEAKLVCQRCLGPLAWPIASDARVALLANESDADGVPQELETVHAQDDRIRVADLVEEEVLLTLPLVPMHESADECQAVQDDVPLPAPAEEAAPAPETQRPFERLGELLKRKQ